MTLRAWAISAFVALRFWFPIEMMFPDDENEAENEMDLAHRYGWCSCTVSSAFTLLERTRMFSISTMTAKAIAKYT